MDNGWIKLHRKILKSGFYNRSAYVHLWVHLLLSANHEGAQFLWNGTMLIINEGQFITGRKKLSLDTGIPESTIEDILKAFEDIQQIRQQKTTKYRLITILNWVSYQNSDNKATTKQQQSDTNKNNNNNKNKRAELSPTTKMKKNSLGKYNESASSDSYEEEIDLDSGQPIVAVKSNASEAMRELIAWAENRRGGKFVNYPKQYKAMAFMRKANLPIASVKERYMDMEKDKFWNGIGFDFMDVYKNFDKKPQ